jgi:hypothetical protein
MPKPTQDPLISLKNRKIVERWHYWTEIKRVRFDDAIENLQYEFFVRERHLMNIIRENQPLFEELNLKHKKQNEVHKDANRAI